jgi:hypothetical protein
MVESEWNCEENKNICIYNIKYIYKWSQRWGDLQREGVMNQTNAIPHGGGMNKKKPPEPIGMDGKRIDYQKKRMADRFFVCIPFLWVLIGTMRHLQMLRSPIHVPVRIQKWSYPATQRSTKRQWCERSGG